MPGRLQTALAVIPARAGSKRIPGKNIRPLAGRPILAYTIDAALESGVFRDVVVSTDGEEIAEVARSCGARVPFLRQPEFADDFVPVSAATVSVLRRLAADGSTFDFVAQLMANCPLRTATDVRHSYEQFVTVGADSQISVARFGFQNPWWSVTRGDGFVLRPLFAESVQTRSQDLPDAFCPTGAIWWAKTARLLQAGTFHMPGRTGWEIPWERALDIDVEADWELAEVLMRVRPAAEAVHA
jgi:N-acylneuraminate cytidylyltransferase